MIEKRLHSLIDFMDMGYISINVKKKKKEKIDSFYEIRVS